MKLKKHSTRLQRTVLEWRTLNFVHKIKVQCPDHFFKTFEDDPITGEKFWERCLKDLIKCEKIIAEYLPEAIMRAHHEHDLDISCPPSRQARGEDIFLYNEELYAKNSKPK